MLVHEAGYTITTQRRPGRQVTFVFRRPDGTVLLGPNLPDRNRPLDTDKEINADTLPPQVSVDHHRIDYPYAVSCFLEAAHQRRARAS